MMSVYACDRDVCTFGQSCTRHHIAFATFTSSPSLLSRSLSHCLTSNLTRMPLQGKCLCEKNRRHRRRREPAPAVCQLLLQELLHNGWLAIQHGRLRGQDPPQDRGPAKDLYVFSSSPCVILLQMLSTPPFELDLRADSDSKTDSGGSVYRHFCGDGGTPVQTLVSQLICTLFS